LPGGAGNTGLSGPTGYATGALVKYLIEGVIAMTKQASEMTVKDYIYCEDCEMFVDPWKYDSIADTGHENCNCRCSNCGDIVDWEVENNAGVE